MHFNNNIKKLLTNNNNCINPFLMCKIVLNCLKHILYFSNNFVFIFWLILLIATTSVPATF